MENEPLIQQLADCFAALGSESRLQIVRLLLTVYPGGMIVGQINEKLGIANSTLSHHLEKLKHENLVVVEREGTALRYKANADTLKKLLDFFMSECCTVTQSSEKPCC